MSYLEILKMTVKLTGAIIAIIIPMILWAWLAHTILSLPVPIWITLLLALLLLIFTVATATWLIEKMP